MILNFSMFFKNIVVSCRQYGIGEKLNQTRVIELSLSFKCHKHYLVLGIARENRINSLTEFLVFSLRVADLSIRFTAGITFPDTPALLTQGAFLRTLDVSCCKDDSPTDLRWISHVCFLGHALVWWKPWTVSKWCNNRQSD